MVLPVSAELVLIVVILVALVTTAYWVWMLVDALRVPDGDHRAGNKLVWGLVIVLAGWLGAAIYQFVGRPQSA